jgi:hypothetical protein
MYLDLDLKVLQFLTPINLKTGDIVAVKAGRMRNVLYPYSMAQYIRPGSNTFLTQNKLAIPVGPNYRRFLRKGEPDPLQTEFKELFERV